MRQQAHPTPHADTVAGRVEPQDRQVSRGQGHEPGAYPQEARLAGTVRALDQDGLAHGHLEVDPRQEREPTRERDRVAEGDCGGRESYGGHGLGVNATGAGGR